MIVHRGRLILGLLFLAIPVLIIVGLVRFGTILGFFLFYPWILSKVSGIVINPHLANIVALMAAVVIYYGLYRYLYRRNKAWGYAGLIVLMVLQSGFMFLSESNRFFSLEGKNLRFYTTNPLTGEFQMFDREVYDAFGQKAQPVNYRMATEIYRQRNEDKFPNKEVPFSSIKNFFAVVTGQALVYYCQDDSGKCHFFMHQGFDPESGRKLLPVTPKVVDEARSKLGKEARVTIRELMGSNLLGHFQSVAKPPSVTKPATNKQPAKFTPVRRPSIFKKRHYPRKPTQIAQTQEQEKTFKLIVSAQRDCVVHFVDKFGTRDRPWPLKAGRTTLSIKMKGGNSLTYYIDDNPKKTTTESYVFEEVEK